MAQCITDSQSLSLICPQWTGPDQARTSLPEFWTGPIPVQKLLGLDWTRLDWTSPDWSTPGLLESLILTVMQDL